MEKWANNFSDRKVGFGLPLFRSNWPHPRGAISPTPEFLDRYRDPKIIAKYH